MAGSDTNFQHGHGRPPSILYGPCAPAPLRLTFTELLDYHAEVRPRMPVAISHSQSRTLSFKQLQDRSTMLAGRMREDGVKRGDLVGIILGNRLEYFEVRCHKARKMREKSLLTAADLLCLRKARGSAGAVQLCVCPR